MTFANFSQHLAKIEPVSSRLKMTELLADLFADLNPQEVPAACYLMQGQLVPTYQSLEFQLSTKMVIRALAALNKSEEPADGELNLFGETNQLSAVEKLTKKYKQAGDIGDVAQQLAGGKNSEQSIIQIYDRLVRIAKESGSGSQERKTTQLAELFKDVDATSARYIARIVVGKLRLGFSVKTMMDALSWAKVGDKTESYLIDAAYNKQADIGTIAQHYLSEASASQRKSKLEKIEVKLGIPVMAALCQRLNSTQEIVQKMGQVIAEPKYDGLRIQIHVDKKNSEQPYQAFTRNLENVTHMFPELEEGLKQLKVSSCILDAEAIGFNPKTGELVEFQKTITRRRKHNVGEKAVAVPLRFYVFDVLLIDGKDVSQEKMQDRKDLLKGLFSENGVFFMTPYIVSDNPDELRNFHEEQLAHKLEGAVMKKLDSGYVSGRTGWTWVKIKEEEGTTGKLSDTLDVILMGYYVGRGARQKFGLGALLAGVRQQDSILTITKIGTGMTEDQLVELKKISDANQSPAKPKQYQVPKDLEPDVWVKPEIVLEVAADEITTSPKHTAGVALRFPRLIRIRTDKNWQQATSVKEVKQIKS